MTPKLTYALDPSGKMVNIGCVARGLSCNCRCPKCKEPLVAKHGFEGGRQPHFAHQKGSDCHGSYMTALHKLAEQIIEEEKTIMAPPYKDIEKQKLSFEQVEVEQRVERKDLQPDLVGITSDGMRWFIEIRNTHEVDETKRNKILESNITCLEIDVREQTLENLKTFLLESIENREWINNPNYDSQIAEKKRKKVSQIVELLFGGKEYVIPEYGKYYSKKVRFDTVSVLQKSADGLFVRVKCNVSEEIPCVFDIGTQETLDTMIPTLIIDRNCNELSVNADSVYSENTIHSCFLDTKWIYHNLSEKEHYTMRFHDTEREASEEVVSNSIPRIELSSRLPKKVQVPNRVENTSSDNLPFENFWTIDDYYQKLCLSRSYKTEKGVSAEILYYEKVGNEIIILYKDPVEVRTYCPYHISILWASDGDIIRNKVAVFTNQNAAKNSYDQRLEIMRNSISTGWDTQSQDGGLPF